MESSSPAEIVKHGGGMSVVMARLNLLQATEAVQYENHHKCNNSIKIL